VGSDLRSVLRFGAELTVTQVRQLLAEQREAVLEWRRQWKAAEQVLDDLVAAEDEDGLPEAAGSPRPLALAPAQAYASEQTLRAEQAQDDLERRFESWAAWWGDSATLALESLADGRAVPVVRLLAGAPRKMLQAEDLAAVGVRDVVQGRDEGARPPGVDAARAQLWGSAWSLERLHLPDLPTAERLTELLQGCHAALGMSSEHVARIQTAHHYILDAVAAHLTAWNTATDPGRSDDDEVRLEAAWARADQRFDRLVSYADAVTGWVIEVSEAPASATG
jgi:hypothetical protein